MFTSSAKSQLSVSKSDRKLQIVLDWNMGAMLYNTSEKFRQDERIVDVVVCNVAGSIIIGRHVETPIENDKLIKWKVLFSARDIKP